jgi:hypothetical protein
MYFRENGDFYSKTYSYEFVEKNKP